MNQHVLQPLSIDRVRLLSIAAKHFRTHGDEHFISARGLEHLNLEKFKATQLDADGMTIFTEIGAAFREYGGIIGETFGEMNVFTGFTQEDAHKIGCACILGECPTGSEIVKRIDLRITELI